ncbi:hypothetical protein Gotur_031606 [Gossypium turneri]
MLILKNFPTDLRYTPISSSPEPVHPITHNLWTNHHINADKRPHNTLWTSHHIITNNNHIIPDKLLHN